MADLLIDKILDKIINTCFEYLQDHFGSQNSMEKELQRLRENHCKIQAVLSVSDEAHITDQNSPLNSWIWQLRDAIDEADDLLDEFEYLKLKERVTEQNMEETKKRSAATSFLLEGASKLRKLDGRVLKIDCNLKRLVEVVQKLDKVSAEAMPTAKKYKQCGIEPDFEEKLDIMFTGVVATDKHTFNPSELGFAGIPDDLPPEQLTGDEEGRSINQKEMEESSSLSKRPRLGERKKEKDIFVRSLFDRLIDAFGALPPLAPPDNTILECLGALDALPEVLADMRFHAKCVKKLEDPTRRQIFMALQPELRVEYLRVLLDD